MLDEDGRDNLEQRRIPRTTKESNRRVRRAGKRWPSIMRRLNILCSSLVAMYSFVRDNVTFEAYLGSARGIGFQYLLFRFIPCLKILGVIYKISHSPFLIAIGIVAHLIGAGIACKIISKNELGFK
jgi:hypothetical protein